MIKLQIELSINRLSFGTCHSRGQFPLKVASTDQTTTMARIPFK